MLKDNTANVKEGQVIDLDPLIAEDQIKKGNAKLFTELKKPKNR